MARHPSQTRSGAPRSRWSEWCRRAERRDLRAPVPRGQSHVYHLTGGEHAGVGVDVDVIVLLIAAQVDLGHPLPNVDAPAKPDRRQAVRPLELGERHRLVFPERFALVPLVHRTRGVVADVGPLDTVE